MEDRDREIFERMAKAQERLADNAEKQPGKATTILTTGATVATAFGIFSVIDIILKWIGG
jgi:translation initiation factor 2B subunit (eIF-2B alpha/beta/delta family)